MKRNIRHIIIIASALLGAAFSSCVLDQAAENRAGESDPARIVLGAVSSRSGYDNINPDNTIDKFRVMIFNSAGALAYNKTFNLSVEHPVTIEMMTGVYDFVFIANEDSDQELRGGKTLTDILDDFKGRRTSDVYDIWFSSSAFRNDKRIPMTSVYKNVTVNANHTVTLSGNTVAEPDPWEVEVERLGIRVDLTLKATEQEAVYYFEKLYITKVPDKVYMFASNSGGSALHNNGSYETASPVPAYRSYAYDAGDEYSVVDNVEYFTASDTPIEFEEDATTPGIYYWHKRIILPSSTFAPASDEDKAVLFKATISGRDVSGSLGNDAIGYSASRNRRYRLTATLVPRKPVEFDVTVTPWGNETRVPLPYPVEPEYFHISHVYNSQMISLHMLKEDQEFGYLWYQYANVPDYHDYMDVPPSGTQVVPARKHSCAKYYSKDPSNPWRLPTNDELWGLREYVYQQRDEQNNYVHTSVYNFTHNGWYWAATSSGPAHAYGVQINSGGNGSFTLAKNGTAMIPGPGARCVRNKPALYTTDHGYSYTYALAGSNYSFSFTSSSAWEASFSGDTDMFSTSTTTRSGAAGANQTFSFGLIASTATNKKAYVTFTSPEGEFDPVVVTINGEAAHLSLAPANQTIEYHTAEAYIPITTNIPLSELSASITSNPGNPLSKVTIDHTNRRLVVTNSTQQSVNRTCTVQVSHGTATVTANITVRAPFLAFTSATYYIGAGPYATSGTLSVSTNIPAAQLSASIVSAGGLITSVGMSGVNVVANVNASNSMSSLSGTVRVTNGTVAATTTVRRPPYVVTVTYGGVVYGPIVSCTVGDVCYERVQCPEGYSVCQNWNEAYALARFGHYGGGGVTTIGQPFAGSQVLGYPEVNYDGGGYSHGMNYAITTRCLRR